MATRTDDEVTYSEAVDAARDAAPLSGARTNHCPHCPAEHADTQACPAARGCPGCYPWGTTATKRKD